MADRPIIFSAPMVRALLEGRKTQTRRVLRPQPSKQWGSACMDGPRWWTCDSLTLEVIEEWRLPYAIGDRLWVREAWSIAFASDLAPGEAIERTADECATANRGFACACGDGIVYRATGAQQHPEHGKARWRPSIHMPRWASRLTLIVTDVRAQRLQKISQEDAEAEGVEWFKPNGEQAQFCNYRDAFLTLWNSLYGPDAWDANPWVAAISFRVSRANIDSPEADNA